MSPVALPLPSPRAIIQSNTGHWAGLRHPSKTESETSYRIVCRSRSRFPIGMLKTGPFWWWVWTLSWVASETVMRFNVDLQSPQILRWMLKRSIAHQHKGHYILQWCLAQNKYSLIKSSPVITFLERSRALRDLVFANRFSLKPPLEIRLLSSFMAIPSFPDFGMWLLPISTFVGVFFRSDPVSCQAVLFPSASKEQ